jgi:hypothetical protein
MGDMAVHQPLLRLPRGPDHVVALARANVDGVGLITRTLVQRHAVDGDDLERADNSINACQLSCR